MIDFDFNADCSGCGACVNTCPVAAIEMQSNPEGFLMPTIDRNACVGCGKCNKVCPHINKEKKNSGTVKGVWLYTSSDEDAKKRSSSGAACYELGRTMLSNGGHVSGCAWDHSLNAVHVLGNDMETLTATQGSKYVQSRIGNIYKAITGLLEDGNSVLFSGTPCQATAMHQVVMNYRGGKFRSKLLTVAVICHGVASPDSWNSFKRWVEKENGALLVSVNFRDKSKEGYKKSYCRYEYENGHVTYLPTFLPSSKYIEASLVYNLALRNSCYHCDCKGYNEGIDLVVGDWYAANSGNGRLGTSCLVAFTDRGYSFVTENLRNLEDFRYEEVLRQNPFIEESVRCPANRDLFFQNVHNPNSWETVERLYPPKYKLKKMLVKSGLYFVLKEITK